MKITDDVRYIGVDDHKIDLFEGHFIVPEGMAYNSYLIVGGKTAVMDSVEKGFTQVTWKGTQQQTLLPE